MISISAQPVGTKVLNAAGEPLDLFHGTNAKFDVFSKTSDGGFHFGDVAAAGWRLADLTGDEASPGNRLIKVHLHLVNPLTLTFDAGKPEAWQQVIDAARSIGYDGISYPNSIEIDEDEESGDRVPTISWIAFNPAQIKIMEVIDLHRSIPLPHLEITSQTACDFREVDADRPC